MAETIHMKNLRGSPMCGKRGGKSTDSLAKITCSRCSLIASGGAKKPRVAVATEGRSRWGWGG
jgi:hypothetical protein